MSQVMIGILLSQSHARLWFISASRKFAVEQEFKQRKTMCLTKVNGFAPRVVVMNFFLAACMSQQVYLKLLIWRRCLNEWLEIISINDMAPDNLGWFKEWVEDLLRFLCYQNDDHTWPDVTFKLVHHHKTMSSVWFRELNRKLTYFATEMTFLHCLINSWTSKMV